MTASEATSFEVEGEGRVSALLDGPAAAKRVFVFAHGAGAGMRHPFMAAIAGGLAKRGVATLRYQFPYMERGSKRPDPPARAHAAVRAAAAEAAGRFPKAALFAGGKSFGGRMTSQAQAASPLAGVRGLAFLGFPLHPPGKPSDDRASHLFDVRIPMLFLQGERDDFARLEFLEPVVSKLGPRATLERFADADHSFHVPARVEGGDEAVRERLLDRLAGWMERA